MRRSMGLLLVVLMMPSTGSADTPNPFEPDQMSSDAITTAVESCIESAQKKQPDATRRFHLKFCGCMIDALQDRGIKRMQEAAQACGVFAEKVATEQKPSTSPFQGTNLWGSEAILAGQLGCEDAVKKKYPEKSFHYREIMCSCVMDAVRARKIRDPSKLSAADGNLCEKLANEAR